MNKRGEEYLNKKGERHKTERRGRGEQDEEKKRQIRGLLRCNLVGGRAGGWKIHSACVSQCKGKPSVIKLLLCSSRKNVNYGRQFSGKWSPSSTPAGWITNSLSALTVQSFPYFSCKQEKLALFRPLSPQLSRW
jgi:hypothetical protein